MNAHRHRFRMFAAPASALSAGGLAALLGACCGASWMVAVVGVSGAIAVARRAFLVPCLWLTAFGFAAAALVWVYRAEPGCEDAGLSAQGRRRQIAAWLVLLTMLVLFVAVRGWHSLVL
jgi:hypothetical protein